MTSLIITKFKTIYTLIYIHICIIQIKWHMSHPELKELTRAEQLFDNGKLDEALEIFNDRTLYERLEFQQLTHFQFLKGLLLFYQNKSEELIDLGECMYEEGQRLKKYLYSFDGFFFLLLGLCTANKIEEALSRMKKAESLLEQISDKSKDIILQRKARINVLKAFISYYSGDIESAEKFSELVLHFKGEINDNFEVIWGNAIMAQIEILIRRRLDFAMDYTKKAMSLAKKIKFNHYWIGLIHIGFGVIYNFSCEYELSFEHHFKSLAIFKEINNTFHIAIILNNLGNLYGEKGEYDIGLKYLEESLSLLEPSSFLIEVCLDSLIYVALEKGDDECAQKYFVRLENMYHQSKNRRLETSYLKNKAIMLKRSSRIRDKAKAEDLLKAIITGKETNYEAKILAYIQLCELLITEFRINNNTEVLDELNNYITELLTIAEKTHSHQVYCESLILQAKLALSNFNVKRARIFLTEAQKIAELYGIKRLAMKISYEHDELIKQLHMWEDLKKSKVSISERWELTGLNKQIENMVRKRMIEVPELSDEEPVLLLFLSEGGVPFFSHTFGEDRSFKSHLFGGFLTTIDYFIREMFSEGLDRAIFGEYTLVMKSVKPFFISYIFKGNSYYALQKADNFIDIIKNNELLWKKLLKYFQANQSIQLNEIPQLGSLINEIFITK
jgi:tetratricopeptide (TPR) repeat protein